MQSNYQFNVSVVLALGLGGALTLALSPNDAVGYPSTTVSLGRNPIETAAGEASDGAVVNLFTADEGGDFIVTDVIITMGRNSWTSCRSHATLSLESDGHYVGRFVLQADGNADRWDGSGTNQAQVSHTFASGIRVPSGDALILTVSACEPLNYTLSGYHAQS